MDNSNSNYSRNRHNEHLGVNKIGKNIRKTPLPQSNFGDHARPPSQPQVYNINKNDFRNIVQQLTGSPSHQSQEPLPVVPPPHNHPKSASMRLQRIRPPPLSPINVTRPRMPVQVQSNHGPRMSVPDQFVQPPQRTMVPPSHAGWSTGSDTQSPISAYMRYLQHSINESGNPQTQSTGLLPNPYGPPQFPSPRTSGPPGPLGPPPLPPSPNSQFLLQSPSSYLNLSSPRSPYALLSPGFQHPPPLTPNFPFSPRILGPGSQLPRSPGINFPLSPTFFPVLSPRWRN